MYIKILFDSFTLDEKLSTGWGISYLIDGGIIFDTGEKSSLLFKNMESMGVRAIDIKVIIISHDHWDHSGGLWDMLKENNKLKVYACPNFSREFKDKVESFGNQLIEVDKFTQIGEGVYTTGEIPGTYTSGYMPEQSLVLETGNGLIILTGCAHPGILKIIDNVRQNLTDNIYLVLGGFHLMSQDTRAIRLIVDRFKELGIKKIAPSHCTGEDAIKVFKEKYQDDFIKVKVGQEIEI